MGQRKSNLEAEHAVADDSIPITAETTVADCVAQHPETLEALIGLGFEPLRSAVARKTVARLFTLRQAAALRGLDLTQLLATLRRVAGTPPAAPSDACETVEPTPAESSRVPDLAGDVRVLGLVPCPLRSLLTERFDRFARELTARTGESVAWWLAGEGAGSRDVAKWLNQLARGRDLARVPDVLLAVGTGMFLHRGCGRPLFDEGLFDGFPIAGPPRPELAPLADPRGVLGLQFAVLFALVVRPELLPDHVDPPRTWLDLSRPEYRGHVALPALDLPVIPDLLAALHEHLGEAGFEGLARNIGAALHPARSSPRDSSARGPAVIVVPLHFSRIAASTGAVEVLPADGLIAVPAYLAARADASAATLEVVRHLCSPDFLEPFWQRGSFLPNNLDVPAQPPSAELICRRWDSFYLDFPEAVTVRLLKLIEPGAKR